MNKTTAASYTPSSVQPTFGNWIAFDLEWELEPQPGQKNINCLYMQHPYNTDFTSGISVPPGGEDYRKILTFGYEDSYGNNGTLDISDFMDCPNPEKSFLEAIKAKLLQYKYCFAWGSKAIKHKNENKSNWEGINGDLVMLDINLRQNCIPSIVRYDKFSKVPYIKHISDKSNRTTDIDLLQIFAKPLVKYVIFKNKYKSLRIHEIATSLLGYGKLDNKSGANISNMSVDERKAYCMHDAHLVAELVKINNCDILTIMQVIASHTGLKLEEVCHKGMTGIWTKILNDVISRKIALLGFDNLPSAIRKLYFSNHHHSHSEYKQIEEDFEEWELEDDEETDKEDYDRIDKQEDDDSWYSTKSKYQYQKEERQKSHTRSTKAQ